MGDFIPASLCNAEHLGFNFRLLIYSESRFPTLACFSVPLVSALWGAEHFMYH